jgi:hypothetical protein
MSETRVVNVRVAHIRPKHPDLRAWCADRDNVYIGRGGIVFLDDGTGTGARCRYPPRGSLFANQFKVGKHGDHARVVELYRQHVKSLLGESSEARELFAALRGKNLGCWCKPGPCHGDVLVEMLQDVCPAAD